ncbi:MAG: TolC family protein [Bdellovibrionales bacterium]|nr:TolC family protein [Bdellovibrionales bacterium]
MKQFLEQVRNKNDSYRAAQEAVEASGVHRLESELLTQPNLFLSAEYKDDGKPSFIPTFNYEKLLTQTYMAGISKQTLFGLQGKFYYSLMETSYKGLFPTYDEGRPTIELSQSLWRNDFGSELRAQVKAQVAQSQAKQFSEKFKMTSTLVQAETSYWRLNLARQSYTLGNENLARGEKIYSWAKKRVDQSLADRSDLLQAKALLKARQLDLKVYQDELRSASLAFNSARGVDSDQVDEVLEPLSGELIKGLKIAEVEPVRSDVLAAREQSKALQSLSVVSQERNQPQLEVYGAYAFNSRESNKQSAFSESWERRPTQIIGVRFSTPISWSQMTDLQHGYAKEARAAELNYQRQEFLQQQDWRDLKLHFIEAKSRLAEAEELEKVQKEKLDHERSRQEWGRTTLFQVLTFEGDLISAQALRLRYLAEVLQVAAQMKLYGSEQ